MPYLKKETLCPEPIDCKILTAALELFVKKGYHRVSIHDINKASCVSIGSIYNHFGGKEGIAKALYLHIVNEFDELIDDIIVSISSPSNQCLEIIKQLFDFTETHQNIIAFLFNTKHSDFITDLPTLYSTSPIIKINTLIERAISKGQFKNIDPVIVFSGLFGSSFHMIQLRLDHVINNPLNEYFSSYVKTNPLIISNY